jgi:UDP-N-acetylglucosamine 1-carboxyvinyltransferase
MMTQYVKAGDFIRSAKIKTLPYPGFPTDMQPQMAVVLTMANGSSTVTESIFENRFKYVDELTRMGAIMKVEGNTAFITGVGSLAGAQVAAPDLRAGAALVIAGMAANGFTVVDDIVYIQRGYERFEEKLSGLGAIIAKVDSEKEERKFKLKVG